ncbi:MAG: rpoD2 [Bacilli bacterium]|nr:rpoD2 [Bacilli bacterium]
MEISEDNVIALLKIHHPEALGFIMDKYGKSVFGLVYRMLHEFYSKEDIEECVSDVFIAAWTKINEYDENKGGFKTWLLILAKYKALDHRRKMLRKPMFEELKVEPIDHYEMEQTFLLKEEANEIVRMIESFEPIDRSIFYKRYFFYESLEAIAQSMGLSYKAVENRLRRSRNGLKEKLNPDVQEEL